MQNRPAITILMPAYNVEKYIKQAVSSIINQSFTDWELLIGDDKSVDNTFNVIQELSASDKRIKVFNQSQNLGYLLNSNYLWAKAIGRYITFMDADDWSDKKRLEIQYNFLEVHRDIDICSTNYYRADENSKVISKFISDENISLGKSINDFLFDNAPFPVFAGSLFFRKEVSDQIGYYHEFFSRKCGEDWDWVLRASQSFKIVSIPKFLYYYRENSSGVTQKLTVDKLINRSLITNIYQILYLKNQNLLEPRLNNELLDLEANLKLPYLKDASLLAYQQACNNIYHKDFKSALKNIRIAIYRRPLKLKYFRTLKFIFTQMLKK